jgi:RNA polymerase subunit RPABC4/transcription elongation factor Spt4
MTGLSKYCQNCGAEIDVRAEICPKCGVRVIAETSSSGVEIIIPYKNGMAVISYYLGVFSLAFGFVLGIPAVICGIIGLRNANRHPETKGKIHAWVGIILGFLGCIICSVLIGAIFFNLR